MTVPDPYLATDGLLVFPHHVAKGFTLDLPDRSQAKPEVLNANQELWTTALNQLPDNYRLQLQFDSDSDYRPELRAYQQTTEAISNPWVRSVRQEKLQELTASMAAGKLRRKRSSLFVSRCFEGGAGLRTFNVRATCEAAFIHINQEFAVFGQNLARQLDPQGGTVRPMAAEQMAHHYAHFFNPTLPPDFDAAAHFDPERSLLQNFLWSEVTGTDFGLIHSDRYHGLRVLTCFPRQVHPLVLAPLLALNDVNLRITGNLTPLSVEKEIAREEREFARNQSQHRMEGRPSLLTVLDKKQRKIQALAQRHLRPFRVEFIIQFWADSREALQAAGAAVQQAVLAMGGGAQCAAPTLPISSCKMFLQTLPGFPWGSACRSHLYAESTWLPDILPLEASFTGRLGSQPNALYLSPQKSVVGISCFSRDQPLHFAIIGPSGVGKSMFVGDLISQTPFDRILLTDYGQSHEAIVKAICPECCPIVIESKGRTTINYLYPGGLPVTADHLSQITDTVLVQIGQQSDERFAYRVRGVVIRGVQQLFDWKLRELERDNFPQALEIARVGMVLESRLQQQPDLSVLDNFIAYRDLTGDHPEAARRLLEAISEAQALEFLKSSRTRLKAAYLAAAWLAPSQCPTHSDLQQLLQLEGSAIDRDLTKEVAEHMAEWRRDGEHGPLLDGVSTIKFDTAVSCIELGKISESDDALQQVGRQLVRNLFWQYIFGLSRRLRKLAIFEETPALLDFPKADILVRRAYEQARKYNTVIGTVWQNYFRLRESPIRAAVMGNSQQFFLLKQTDVRDLKSLAEDLGLADTAMNAISSYPRPADAGEAHFTLLVRDTPHDLCGTAIHRPTPAMFYATCSTPAHVEQRRKELDGAANVAQRIQQLTTRS